MFYNSLYIFSLYRGEGGCKGRKYHFHFLLCLFFLIASLNKSQTWLFETWDTTVLHICLDNSQIRSREINLVDNVYHFFHGHVWYSHKCDISILTLDSWPSNVKHLYKSDHRKILRLPQRGNLLPWSSVKMLDRIFTKETLDSSPRLKIQAEISWEFYIPEAQIVVVFPCKSEQ